MSTPRFNFQYGKYTVNMSGNRTHVALLSYNTPSTTVLTRHHAILCFDVCSHMKSEKHQ